MQRNIVFQYNVAVLEVDAADVGALGFSDRGITAHRGYKYQRKRGVT
jgi:hypothetical protein